MAKPNDQQGVKLPVPSKKALVPAAHDDGPMAHGLMQVHSFTDSKKSPAKADRVVKGLQS